MPDESVAVTPQEWSDDENPAPEPYRLSEEPLSEPWWVQVVGPTKRQMQRMVESKLGIEGACAQVSLDPKVLTALADGRGNELTSAEIEKAEVALRWLPGCLRARPSNPREMCSPMNPELMHVRPGGKWETRYDYMMSFVHRLNEKYPSNSEAPSEQPISPLVRRETLRDPAARAVTLQAVEELLLQAEAFRADPTIDTACLSLAPQLRAPQPNVTVVAALFAELIGYLHRDTPTQGDFADSILQAVSSLGSPDAVADGAIANAILAETFEHSVSESDWLPFDDYIEADALQPSWMREIHTNVVAGLREARPDFMASIRALIGDLLRKSPDAVAGATGRFVLKNGSSVGAFVLGTVLGGPGIGGLAGIAVRFVIGAYMRLVDARARRHPPDAP